MKYLRTPGLIVLGVLCIFAAGMISALSERTLVPLWCPLLYSFLAAIVLWVPLRDGWARFTLLRSRWLNAAIHGAVCVLLLAGLYYTLNYYGGSREPEDKEKAVVTRLYSETHYRTKRVSRKVYVRDTDHPYQVYKMDIRLSDGAVRPVTIGRSRRRGLEEGDTVEINLRRGLLGATVFDAAHIDYPEKQKQKRKPKIQRFRKDAGR